MEGSPLGLIECGSEGDIDSIPSPGYGQHPALVKSPVSQDWACAEFWDAATLSEFMEPLPDDHGLNNALEWSQYPLSLDPCIDTNAQPIPSEHQTQRSNMSNLIAESQKSPVTFFPGPANFAFDGGPAQGS